MGSAFNGTTICAVKKDGRIAIAGDGQVTMGEHTIFKSTARKIRRLYHGKVVVKNMITVKPIYIYDDYGDMSLKSISM